MDERQNEKAVTGLKFQPFGRWIAEIRSRPSAVKQVLRVNSLTRHWQAIGFTRLRSLDASRDEKSFFRPERQL